MLNHEQAEKLFEHLISALQEPGYAAFMVEEIDARCHEVKKEIHQTGTEKAFLFDDDIHEIQKCLDDHHNLDNYRAGRGQLDADKWWNLVYRLADLVELKQRTDKRGAPDKEWRSDLIHFISHFYPDEFARKSRGGHFEQTIMMVLGFIDSTEIPDDAERACEKPHEMVIEALRYWDGGGTNREALRAAFLSRQTK